MMTPNQARELKILFKQQNLLMFNKFDSHFSTEAFHTQEIARAAWNGFCAGYQTAKEFKNEDQKHGPDNDRIRRSVSPGNRGH